VIIALAVHGDYQLLQQINEHTAQKYVEMAQNTTEMNGQLSTILEKCLHTMLLARFAIFPKDKQFAPYLQQIDQMDAALSQLEASAKSLDDYSKKLGLALF